MSWCQLGQGCGGAWRRLFRKNVFDNVDPGATGSWAGDSYPGPVNFLPRGSHRGRYWMSRAFLRDDAEGEMPRRNYGLPERDDPEFDRVAARALLEAARVSETQLAERATGYYWGEPRLRPYVAELLVEAEASKDERLEQLARRVLR